MKIIIKVDDSLTRSDSLNLFIKEFKRQLKSGVNKAGYKSEFLNFEWKAV